MVDVLDREPRPYVWPQAGGSCAERHVVLLAALRQSCYQLEEGDLVLTSWAADAAGSEAAAAAVAA